MMSFKLGFFLTFIAYIPGALLWECNEIESKSAELRLKRYLFCDYDTSIRPSVHHSNATVIGFALIPRFVEIIDYDNSFNLHTWMVLTWVDPHIEWEAAQYDGIGEIHLQTSDIWVPDITVHNPGDAVDSEVPILGCWGTSKGDVRCVSSAKFSGHCEIDHKWWPYETYNCTIQFASWSHTGDEISFRLMTQKLHMNEYEGDNQLILEKAYITEHTEPFKMDAESISHFLAVHVILKGSASYHYITFILPVFVLAVLTLTTLWLEPKSTERSVIANVNFICHLLCLLDIEWLIPHNGPDVPNIIVFYNGSLALATFALILTTCLRHLQELNSETPMWISSGTSQILKSKFGQILLLSILDPKASAGLDMEADDNTDLVRSKKKTVGWEYVVILIGWAAFLGTLMLYVIMLGTILPTENVVS